MNWSRVDYLWIIVMFLSAIFWQHTFTVVDSTGEQVMYRNTQFLQICSYEETNSSTNKLILNGLRSVNVLLNFNIHIPEKVGYSISSLLAYSTYSTLT